MPLFLCIDFCKFWRKPLIGLMNELLPQAHGNHLDISLMHSFTTLSFRLVDDDRTV